MKNLPVPSPGLAECLPTLIALVGHLRLWCVYVSIMLDNQNIDHNRCIEMASHQCEPSCGSGAGTHGGISWGRRYRSMQMKKLACGTFCELRVTVGWSTPSHTPHTHSWLLCCGSSHELRRWSCWCFCKGSGGTRTPWSPSCEPAPGAA